ncbi:OsmC family protein [Pararhizobium sp.]|uniref:OsmC family protein n=1 Tax=Pararhizobium sp. TaxID=1977563 RepID=UPI002721BA62|nr:OsmC family protein [Pararhizobium sp.]MDO9416158.1 OsmC family protein [Pararhizobium sp.]
MSESKFRLRPTGATASLGRTGLPHVTSVTGGHLDLVTAPSQEGFSPLDLLYASLAGCLVLSARMAASQMGLLEKLEEVTCEVTGTKADGDISRIESFQIRLSIRGDLDDETRHRITDAAENQICTVSNTLRGNSAFDLTVSG